MVDRHNGNPKWEITQFNESFTERVTELANRSMSETYSPKVIEEIYRSWKAGFLLLMNGSDLSGFICGSKYSGTEARILLLAVEYSSRRLGLGSKLVDAFMNVCKSAGFLSVRLEVRTDNDSAIAFYRKHGFSITSTLIYYYSDLSDAYQMWRML